jgi:hypothetical protein
VRLKALPEKVFVAPSRIAAAASPDRKEAEIPSSARLGGNKALERLPNRRRDRLLAPAGHRAQVSLHPFVVELTYSQT